MMQRTDSTLSGRGSRTASASGHRGTITPLFPLLLLETLRDRDRPEEVLEDEDVTVSMPRRLGLSDVVGVQIRRFQEEVRARRLQSTANVIDLMRLVVRRPDAAEIFEEAGRRLARHAWSQRSSTARRLLRVAPKPISRGAARRAARRIFRQIAGDGKLAVGRWPIDVRLRDSISSRADPNGAACSFYSGAFAEVMQLHTAKRYRVVHGECICRGSSECQWTVEVEE